MRTLDLSKTGLTHADVNQFIIEICNREVKLTKLVLSENSSINDEVLEDLSKIFLNQSTMKEIYLDSTSITNKGLTKLLSSIKESMKVNKISVCDCNLNLLGEEGQKIAKILNENISLTDLSYTGNTYD